MFTITVRYDEKQSTTSQYENVTAGVLVERRRPTGPIPCTLRTRRSSCSARDDAQLRRAAA